MDSHSKSWLDVAESFYRASLHLVEGVAENRLNEDTEGIAAAFLFRHYLELSLKNIILAGRFLTKEGQNAPREDAVPAWGHNLSKLWKLVLSDAKPKMETDWGSCDTDFVEKCIAEFDRVDPKGMAFRYTGEGAASLRVHFGWLHAIMEHVHQVLEPSKRVRKPPSQGAEPVVKCGYGSSDERSHGKTTDAGRDSADCGGVRNEWHATE